MRSILKQIHCAFNKFSIEVSSSNIQSISKCVFRKLLWLKHNMIVSLQIIHLKDSGKIKACPCLFTSYIFLLNELETHRFVATFAKLLKYLINERRKDFILGIYFKLQIELKWKCYISLNQDEYYNLILKFLNSYSHL